MWLEDNWDHRFLAWEKDPMMKGILRTLNDAYDTGNGVNELYMFKSSLVWMSFNPTAENMAEHLVTVIGPQQLKGTGVILHSVKVEETAKCHASFSLGV